MRRLPMKKGEQIYRDGLNETGRCEKLRIGKQTL
jgi:hypothetical protein